MASKFWGALLLIGMMGPAAAAITPTPVPTPDIGEGVLGMLLAAGAVYVMKRRRR
jgi:hypothetical protein